VVGVAVADVNKDGILDIIARSVPGPSAPIGVHLGNGDGTFRAVIPSYPPADSFAVGDLDGDGTPDLVTGVQDHLAFRRGNGDGTFGTDVTIPSPGRNAWVAIADLDNDSKLDLASISSDSLMVARGNGNGTFQAGVAAAIAASSGHAFSFPLFVDMNADGVLDLIVADLSGPGAIAVAVGKGGATFQPATLYATGAIPANVAVGDLDLDGRLDLVAAASSATSGWTGVALLRGGAGGSLLGSTLVPSGYHAAAVALADLDGDGLLDVVIADDRGGSAALYGSCR
jgi:hypothetical protein